MHEDDTEEQAYFKMVYDELTTNMAALKVEFLEWYLNELEVKQISIDLEIDMDFIYSDTPKGLWNPPMFQIYAEAREAYAQRELIPYIPPDIKLLPDLGK